MTEVIALTHASPSARNQPPTRIDCTVLPPTVTHAVRFAATEAQALPPLPTTALHGALGRALRDLGCGHGARQGCTTSCAAGLLLEPPAISGLRAQGVTDRAPPALVLGATATPTREPVKLRAGEVWEARVTLIGEHACRERALVLAALHRVGVGGLGVAEGRGDDRRPSLAVERITAIDAPERPPSRSAVIELLSPTRLVSDGHVQSSIDAELLWRALVRRADALARYHGTGAVCDGPPPKAPFEIVSSSLRVVSVDRWSSRQERRMRWPGVVGAIEIAGDGLRAVWPIVQFAERVGLGKATSFGLGTLRVLPLEG